MPQVKKRIVKYTTKARAGITDNVIYVQVAVIILFIAVYLAVRG